MLSTFPPHPWSHSAILRWFLRLPLSSLLSPSQADRILQYVRPKYRRCYLPAISNMTLLSKKKKKIKKKKKKKKKGLMHPGLDSYTNTIVKSTTPVSHGLPKRCVVGFTSTGRRNHAVTTVTVTLQASHHFRQFSRPRPTWRSPRHNLQALDKNSNPDAFFSPFPIVGVGCSRLLVSVNDKDSMLR